MQINNYQSQPKFTSLHVDQKSIDRLMQSFQDCSTPRILEGIQVLKGMKNSSQTYKMRDLGYCAGQACYGHVEITAGNKVYTNSNPFSISGYRDIVYFLKKVFNKGEKSNPNSYSKEYYTLNAFTGKLEVKDLKKALKVPEANKEQIRDGLLDYAFELMRK